MATKKPTTKKKTTTTKAKKATTKAVRKPAAKKAVASAKTTKKTTSKKVAAKKTQTKTSKAASKIVALQNMRKFNIFSALLLAVGAGLLVTYGNEFMTVFTSSYLAENALTETGEVLPAVREVFNVDLNYVIAGILGIAAVWRALLATSLRSSYEKQVSDKLTSLNWVELGIVSPLVVMVIATLVGVRDIMTLLLMFGVVSATAVLGYLSDRYSMTTKRSLLKIKIAGSALLLPWAVIGVALLHTYVYGLLTLSVEMYAIIALSFVLYLGLAVAHKKQIAATGRFSDFMYGEQVIAAIHVLLLVVMAAVPFVG